MSTFLNFTEQRTEEAVGVVLVGGSSVIAHGGDPASGVQFDKPFVPGRLDGKKACIAIVPRPVADSWTRHLGAILRVVTARAARKLHEAAKKAQKDGSANPLRDVWQGVLGEPWPVDAEARNVAEERLNLAKILRDRFYPVESEWTIEQLRRYAKAPELIAEDKMAALGAKPGRSYDPPKTEIPDDVVDEFLKGSDD